MNKLRFFNFWFLGISVLRWFKCFILNLKVLRVKLILVWGIRRRLLFSIQGNLIWYLVYTFDILEKISSCFKWTLRREIIFFWAEDILIFLLGILYTRFHKFFFLGSRILLTNLSWVLFILIIILLEILLNINI